MRNSITNSACLFALLLFATLSSAFADTGSIQERESERRIEFTIENRVATFTLLAGNTRHELRRLEVSEVSDPKLNPEKIGLTRFDRTRAITDGYGDVTDWLIENLDMGIIFMPFISGPIYVGYSLSYLYTIPADALGAENSARRKYIKLVRGKNIKASKKVFGKILRALST